MNQKIPEIDEQIAQLIASLPSDRPRTASDGYGKAAIADKSRPYGATHHPHRVFSTVGNTANPSPDAHAVQNRRGKLMTLLQYDEVSMNSFVRFSLIPINSDSFALILANTTNRVGFS